MYNILIDLPEIMESENLILQVPKQGFGKLMHHALIDGYDDYIKWLNFPTKKPSVTDVEIDCRKHHAEFILRTNIRYLIINKDNQIVGRCSFPPIQANWHIPQFGISYFIAKQHRNKGYATEATAKMIEIALQYLKAKKIEIYCDSENIASNKVPQKLGFNLEYITRGVWHRNDGKLANLKCYALFAENIDNLSNNSIAS